MGKPEGREGRGNDIKLGGWGGSRKGDQTTDDRWGSRNGRDHSPLALATAPTVSSV